jgi:hypothetical protein
MSSESLPPLPKESTLISCFCPFITSYEYFWSYYLVLSRLVAARQFGPACHRHRGARISVPRILIEVASSVSGECKDDGFLRSVKACMAVEVYLHSLLTSPALTPGKEPRFHWMGGKVCPRAGPDVLDKRKIYFSYRHSNPRPWSS